MDYISTFSALMGMTTVIVLALARVCIAPARLGNVRNPYIKAEKEENLEIVLHMTQGMELDAGKMKYFGY